MGKRHSREEGEEQLERRRQSRTGGDRYGDKETKHGSGKDKDRRKEANQEILFISTQSMTEDDKAWGRRQSRREEDNSANTVILPSENLLSYTHANKDLLSTFYSRFLSSVSPILLRHNSFLYTAHCYCTVYQASSILLLKSTFYPKFLYPPSAFLLLYLLFSSFSFSFSPASCPVLFHACLLCPFCSSPSLNVHSLRTLMFNTALSFSYFTSSFLLLFFYPAPIPFGCPLRSSLGTSEERGA